MGVHGVLKRKSQTNIEDIRRQSAEIQKGILTEKASKVDKCLEELPKYYSNCEQNLTENTDEKIIIKNKNNLIKCKELIEEIEESKLLYNQKLREKAEYSFGKYRLKGYNILWKEKEDPDFYEIIRENIDTLFRKTDSILTILTERSKNYNTWVDIPYYLVEDEKRKGNNSVEKLADVKDFVVSFVRIKRREDGVYGCKFINDQPVSKFDETVRFNNKEDIYKDYKEFCNGYPIVGINIERMITASSYNGLYINKDSGVYDIGSLFSEVSGFEKAKPMFILSSLGVYTYQGDGSQLCYYLGEAFIQIRENLKQGILIEIPDMVYNTPVSMQ